MCPVSPSFGLNPLHPTSPSSRLTQSLSSLTTAYHDKSRDLSANSSPTTVMDSGAVLECFIELRDLGSSISKQSKESMVNGDFLNGLDKIKQTLAALVLKVDSIDTSMQQIIQNGGDSRIFGNSDEGRVPVLTRPRRFRKSKLKNKSGDQTPTSVGANSTGCESPESLDSSASSIKNGSSKRKSAELKHCTSCGTTSSPEWRKGPAGNQSLCNACGLYFAKLVRREASLAWKPQSVVKVNDLLCVGGVAAAGGVGATAGGAAQHGAQLMNIPINNQCQATVPSNDPSSMASLQSSTLIVQK
ncbi:hypothetical protein SAMD00019534_082120 [Acytostelium subglobosum LB1]|uniref:hypothetical protein n=1 Tax=Acytostelium subglobosum LB1 TaxID=1410327 RepID=UPI0006448F62|nr:hypothetical protein SAMD00019534_082120 [Acytostelium subglobosum LB1]GAM25037.1 hypothetical protein SAMD00019534_082120 [Acytostelium subglobosum LB1]|eukprot:XP_012752126.1 hypothetical protein SAMD00019534_082120 [Acytostelium subglobosum LB1]